MIRRGNVKKQIAMIMMSTLIASSFSTLVLSSDDASKETNIEMEALMEEQVTEKETETEYIEEIVDVPDETINEVVEVPDEPIINEVIEVPDESISEVVEPKDEAENDAADTTERLETEVAGSEPKPEASEVEAETTKVEIEPPKSEAPNSGTKKPVTQKQVTQKPISELENVEDGFEDGFVEFENDEVTEKQVKKEKKDTKSSSETSYSGITGESVYVLGSYPVANVVENTNLIYDYLTKKMKLNHAAACGVLANIQCESNFSPTAVGDNGTSYGLCQWHLERFTSLIGYCGSNDGDFHTVESQMEYMHWELENVYKNVLEYLQKVPDTEEGAYDAAYFWCKYYERPSHIEYNSEMRGDLAKNGYFPKKFGTKKVIGMRLDEKEDSSKN